jgi:hypothetical protein
MLKKFIHGRVTSYTAFLCDFYSLSYVATRPTETSARNITQYEDGEPQRPLTVQVEAGKCISILVNTEIFCSNQNDEIVCKWRQTY